MSRLIIVLMVAAALVGCKANLQTAVNLSELVEGKTNTLNGNMYLEVASCNSYEDSRKPSDAVVKAQKTVPAVFKGAKFVECFTKQFDSYAHFQVPIALDKVKDDKLASQKHINLISNKGLLLGLSIPDSIRQGIERVEQESYGTTSFQLNVQIKVTNDLGKDLDFAVISAYLDEQPLVYRELNSPAGSTFTLTLSDVTVDAALEQRTAMVLLHGNK